MRRSISLVIYLFIVLVLPVKAQFYYHNNKYYSSDVVLELGGSAGIMNSLTDLGGKKGIGKKFIKDINWKVSRPSFSIYAIAMYKYAVGLRLEGTFGSIQSYDTILKKVAPSTRGRYERNLSFKSNIIDIQLALSSTQFFSNRIMKMILLSGLLTW